MESLILPDITNILGYKYLVFEVGGDHYLRVGDFLGYHNKIKEKFELEVGGARYEVLGGGSALVSNKDFQDLGFDSGEFHGVERKIVEAIVNAAGMTYRT